MDVGPRLRRRKLPHNDYGRPTQPNGCTSGSSSSISLSTRLANPPVPCCDPLPSLEIMITRNADGYNNYTVDVVYPLAQKRRKLTSICKLMFVLGVSRASGNMYIYHDHTASKCSTRAGKSRIQTASIAIIDPKPIRTKLTRECHPDISYTILPRILPHK
jgi:hypothetical protein